MPIELRYIHAYKYKTYSNWERMKVGFVWGVKCGGTLGFVLGLLPAV